MLVFIAILSSLALAACTSIKPIFLQDTIDAVGQGAGSTKLFFFCYAASILGILIFEVIRQLSIGKYQANKTCSLKKRVMEKVLHMPPTEFQHENGQNYITMLNNEIDMLVENFYVTRLEFAYSILVLVGSILALLSINLYLALIIIVSTICPILASIVQGKAIEKRTNLYTSALEALNVMIGNFIHGYPTIKVNHAEQEYLHVLNQRNHTTAQAEFAQAGTKVRVNMSAALLAYVGEAILVGFSIFEISRGQLTVGALVGALQLSEMLAIPTNSISYQLSDMNGVKGIRTKIHQLISAPVAKETASASGSKITSIELHNLSFSYEEKHIFSHVDYRFEAGKKYLILGENGSGKSTLFRLLFGFESNYEGNILINGIDSRQQQAALYSQVGVVLQDAFLFDDTLLHNVTLYHSELDCKVEPTLRALGMDDFLASHSLAQEYQATKGNLSGGEKQKLALARVLVQGKNILLLDEATANMDRESSHRILSQLLQTPGLTIISIEHKVAPELLSMYDVILELTGSHLEEHV